MKALSNIDTLDLPTFLERNRISQEDFTKSTIEWELLKAIGFDHWSLFDARKESAEFFAKVIQGCDKVHSVRWRVKDPEHLMEKIVRKRIPGTKNFNKEYLGIDIENYHEIVTDLVGIRALHLFKDDYIEIDTHLRERWNHSDTEAPIYYYRAGDVQELVPEIFNKKEHPAGYRSIHYIFESKPLNKKLFTEVQVRTIFEEGWSEIDHKVRYPNFSEEKTIKYFLDIFNRLAGSADEMGSFVKALDAELKNRTELLAVATDESKKLKLENEESMASMERLIGELEASKGINDTNSQVIKDLKHQVEKLKIASNRQPELTATQHWLNNATTINLAAELALENARMSALTATHRSALFDVATAVSRSSPYLSFDTVAAAAALPSTGVELGTLDLAKYGSANTMIEAKSPNSALPKPDSAKKPKAEK